MHRLPRPCRPLVPFLVACLALPVALSTAAAADPTAIRASIA